MSKSSFVIVFLLIVIGILGWMLWAQKAEAPTPSQIATTTDRIQETPGSDKKTETTPAVKPLHERVNVS